MGDTPRAVTAVFPDPTPATIGAAVDAWCRQALAAEPDHAEFFAASVGSV